MRSRPLLAAALAGAACAACRPAAHAPPAASDVAAGADSVAGGLRPRLPTGVRLDPAGVQYDVGSMPLGMALAPGGRRVALLLSGYREQGVQVVDRETGRVVQTLPQASAFVGLAFSPDGASLWASGGNADVVYRYAWAGDTARLADSVVLAPKDPKKPGTRYAAGLAFAPDGRTLYVAENLGNAVAAVDVATMRVTSRVATERYPYAVVVAADGTAYASAWGGATVSVLRPGAGGLAEAARVRVVRHPSALALAPDGATLFVASGSTDQVGVVDTRLGRETARLSDAPSRTGAAGPVPNEGSTPNALALAADGRRLFVAEADANAVAVFDRAADGGWALAGRVPTAWYPTAVAAAGDTLLVLAGKGRGTAANPAGPRPGETVRRAAGLTLGQLSGTLGVVAGAAAAADLTALSERVARANGWRERTARAAYPPITHVVYVIKENRTYDQVLGDVAEGDGDTSLVFFGRETTPNHHALAARFGLFDRFFVNAEVSPDGHNWSTAAYAGDYVEKSVPSAASGRGRPYDFEGLNRGALPPRDADGGEDDVASGGSGYLWDLALRKGLTLRNYGEYVYALGGAEPKPPYHADKAALDAHTNHDYPGWALDIPDQVRADVWVAELAAFVRKGEMPALEVVRLPNDHTGAARAGQPTPRAYMADNDLALGRMVEALSRSPFWRSTAVFVVEDDAQNGADHVDSHRAPAFVISPYSRGGVSHRFANTTDVIATIEELLGLTALSQFDYYGRPLRDAFQPRGDFRPYAALRPGVPLDEKNPAGTRTARASARLDLRREDAADEALFNAILWRVAKGDSVPAPRPRRLAAPEYKRGE